jgi:hypothetical protein
MRRIARLSSSVMYAITGLKAARNAWYWAVHFQRRGKLHSKRFYDLKLGGADKARAAAISWRHRQIAAKKTLSYRDFHQKKRSTTRAVDRACIS